MELRACLFGLVVAGVFTGIVVSADPVGNETLSSNKEATTERAKDDNPFGDPVAREPAKEVNNPKETGPSKRSLEYGYQTGSAEPLLAFLDAWHADSKPVDADALKKKPPFEQDVYKIFDVIFQPNKRIYGDTQFIVVQNQVDVTVVDSDLKSLLTAYREGRETDARLLDVSRVSQLTVKDFRPRVKLPGKRVLYLTDQYLAHILRLLLPSSDLSGRDSELYQREDSESDERQARLKYLNQALVFRSGHWGTGWEFETHPVVMNICFASDFGTAIVHYRAAFYRGGSTLMRKQEDGTWQTVGKLSMWQE